MKRSSRILLLAASLCGLGAASSAPATIRNYELDLTANHAGWVPLPNGDPMLGTYMVAPLGELFKATFSLDSDLLLADTTNVIPVAALQMAAGDSSWDASDVVNAYFVTDANRDIATMGLLAVNAAGDGFSVGVRTAKLPQPIRSYWSVNDAFFPACAISTDFTFSGPCFGSVNDDIVLTRLPDSVSGGGPEGSVPEPESWVMMIAGLGILGAALRMRPVAISRAHFTL
ncbi:MAG: hypothetical protein DI623_15260 [Sphingomonas sanxanigenens]|uniref:Ice-binding protein C-terminal domain-containing protein n=1 Tax=Sphingomonas sanxanigenens TaxID=397260 RepID=A0A2W5A0P1_9SPHN|nr:MAG: hypothetical protein DI623_15260 [Sphingomonas sanxanigenens]